MKKSTKFYVYQITLLVVLVLATILFFEHFDLPGDHPDTQYGGVNWGFMSMFLCGTAIVLFCARLFWILFYHKGQDKDWPERDDNFYDRNTPSFSFKLSWILILLIPLLFFAVIPLGKRSVELHNTLVDKEEMYKKTMEQRKGFYNKMYNTYLQKEKISTLNREVFIEVTKLVMEGQKDAPTLAWKWASERQKIDYQEFTKFYSDLSAFVQDQREAYYALETSCQNAAAEYNVLLKKFPNNYINSLVLHRDPIKFEYGFLSQATKQMFETKIEKD